MRSMACSVLLAVLALPAVLWADAQDEMLWHYRNLGKAFVNMEGSCCDPQHRM